MKKELAIFDNLVKLDRSNLICVASRPGMGKTSLALHMALEYVKQSHNTVYIFSCELLQKQMRDRIIGAMAEVNTHRMRDNLLSEEQEQSIQRAKEQLKRSRVIIEDDSSITVEELEKRLDQIEDLGLVLIDYLELVRYNQKMNSCEEEHSAVLSKLKMLTQKRNVPIIVTTHLARRLERRKDKHPLLSDLSFHSRMAEDADTVILLYRDAYYNITEYSESEIADVMIAKNQYGIAQTVHLEWLHGCGKFKPIQ